MVEGAGREGGGDVSDKHELLIEGVHRLVCTYTNWRNETSVRKLDPAAIWFGTTAFHPEPQWLMNAWDIEKEVFRDFALRDMKDVTYE